MMPAYTNSGLYYKHVTIVNDDSIVVNKGSFKLIDNARGVIYNCNGFIIQATDFVLGHVLLNNLNS